MFLQDQRKKGGHIGLVIHTLRTGLIIVALRALIGTWLHESDMVLFGSGQQSFGLVGRSVDDRRLSILCVGPKKEAQWSRGKNKKTHHTRTQADIGLQLEKVK